MNTFAALCAPLNLVSCVCCILLVHTFLHSVGYETKTRKIPLDVFCLGLAALSFAPAFLPKYLDVADTVDMTSTLVPHRLSLSDVQVAQKDGLFMDRNSHGIEP